MRLYSQTTFLPQHLVPLQPANRSITRPSFSFTWKKASITELNFRGREESKGEDVEEKYPLESAYRRGTGSSQRLPLIRPA